ncbi:phosphonate C-P lyase system protein PhnG [Taklimakanibacter deserti]|uniref:phosphonate C-P lyase system protein PhnG n=1 Tax=Taklimakanibacter deserti TaxID=2267839 RepID=UPI000E653DBD
MASDESRQSATEKTARQQWMSLLAQALPRRLDALFPRERFPHFVYLRKPETGLVMLRGRVGGTGSPFNMGEATVTRCAIRLDDGTVGHAFVMGRSHEHALSAAICDALLQGSDSDLPQTVIAPLAQERTRRERDLALKNAATKVDFFTMVRGEDD